MLLSKTCLHWIGTACSCLLLTTTAKTSLPFLPSLSLLYFTSPHCTLHFTQHTSPIYINVYMSYTCITYMLTYIHTLTFISHTNTFSYLPYHTSLTTPPIYLHTPILCYFFFFPISPPYFTFSHHFLPSHLVSSF